MRQSTCYSVTAPNAQHVGGAVAACMYSRRSTAASGVWMLQAASPMHSTETGAQAESGWSLNAEAAFCVRTPCTPRCWLRLILLNASFSKDACSDTVGLHLCKVCESLPTATFGCIRTWMHSLRYGDNIGDTRTCTHAQWGHRCRCCCHCCVVQQAKRTGADPCTCCRRSTSLLCVCPPNPGSGCSRPGG